MMRVLLIQVQQPDVSIFIIFSGQAKENLLHHLPLMAGKNKFFNIFGTNQ